MGIHKNASSNEKRDIKALKQKIQVQFDQIDRLYSSLNDSIEDLQFIKEYPEAEFLYACDFMIIFANCYPSREDFNKNRNEMFLRNAAIYNHLLRKYSFILLPSYEEEMQETLNHFFNEYQMAISKALKSGIEEAYTDFINEESVRKIFLN